MHAFGTRKIRVSEAERREREGEQRYSERYGGAVPETMWKHVRAIFTAPADHDPPLTHGVGMGHYVF